MAQVSDEEWQTLADIADPTACLIHDGETIEMLVLKDMIFFDVTCYRLTEHGATRLREHIEQRKASR